MKEKNRKKILALVLCGILLMPACACKEKTAQAVTEKEPDASEEEITPLSDWGLEAKIEIEAETEEQTVQTAKQNVCSADTDASLRSLRNTLENNNAVIGIAYLGYVGDFFEEGFAAGFSEWLEENNQELLEQYPFVASMDSGQIIGSAGHLYAIVPLDKNASLAINRLDYDRVTGSFGEGEVIYRSESGEPVLLFANLDGDNFFPDTEVFLTDETGETYTWYPCLSEKGFLVPCYRNGMEICSLDFSSYSFNSERDLADWLAEGWLGPTALSISGTEEYGQVWHIWTTAWEGDREAFFMIQFYPMDGAYGRVDIDWNYEGERDYEEQWSGYWNLMTHNDWPSYLTLSLSLVGGKRYEATDAPMCIAETYPVVLSLDGERMVIGTGSSGICLPFMSQDTIATTMWLPED